MRRLVLASGSPRRKELLEQAGYVFDIVPSTYEEDMTLDLLPHQLVEVLSRGKASDVAKKIESGSIVLGADTFVVLGNEVLGKPRSQEHAKVLLRKLSGCVHSVLTGVTIIDIGTNREKTIVVESRVCFKDLSEKEIDDYVQTGESVDKAGAYALQGRGGALIDYVRGSTSNVIGLPVEEVSELLRDFGVETKKPQ